MIVYKNGRVSSPTRVPEPKPVQPEPSPAPSEETVPWVDVVELAGTRAYLQTLETMNATWQDLVDSPGALSLSQVKRLNEINWRIIGLYRVMLNEASQNERGDA